MLALLAAAGLFAGPLTLGALEKRGLVEVGRDRIWGRVPRKLGAVSSAANNNCAKTWFATRSASR
jgi:hypothetical protein